MLQSSVSRRLACVRPSTSTITASRASITTGARCHQRRNSSSKPPIPPSNGSSPINSASVKHVGGPRSDKRPVAKRSTKLKSDQDVKAQDQDEIDVYEDMARRWTRTLPAVPSTQHLNPKDLYVASFFGIHRPISITGALPPEASINDIDKIFTAKPTPQRRTAEVIYTLSSAVNDMDAHVGSQEEDANIQQKVDIIKALTRGNDQNPNNVYHLDGQQGMKVSIQAITRDFRPYRVPPPPVPMPELGLHEPEIESRRQGTKSTTETPQSKTDIGSSILRGGELHIQYMNALDNANSQRNRSEKQLWEDYENHNRKLAHLIRLVQTLGASPGQFFGSLISSLSPAQVSEVEQAWASFSQSVSTFARSEEVKHLTGKQKKTRSLTDQTTEHLTEAERKQLVDAFKILHQHFDAISTAADMSPSAASKVRSYTNKMAAVQNSFFTPSFTPTSSRRVRRGMLTPLELAIRNARLPSIERAKMFLISVKRQRRLKMKKHKYKKLQRKTRNLRRRQGKI